MIGFLSKNEINIIIQNLQNKEDLENILNVLPDRFRPTIYKKIFEVEFPYVRLDDLPKKYRNDYESATNYIVKLQKNKPSIRYYEDCILNRRPNKCMMIPVNFEPPQDVFELFWIEFGEEYLNHLDAIDDMYAFLSKKRMRDDIITISDVKVKDVMTSLMVGLKLVGTRNSTIYYELSLSRKYLFSQMLVDYELIPLIPRVADCIVDLDELGFREHRKYWCWCLQRENENFKIGGCDTRSFSDYGTIPKEFSFPTYSPEYFWDIVSYNKVLRIDINHPEINEQLKKQRNNATIELKTTSPPNYLFAESDNAGLNRDVEHFKYVNWINDELKFY